MVKKIIIFCGILVFPCMFYAGQMSSLKSNLISLWHFNEGLGTIAKDEKGANQGSISNAAWVAGLWGSTLYYNGSTAKTTIPNDTPQIRANQNWSMSVWIQTTSSGAPVTYDNQNIIHTQLFGKGDALSQELNISETYGKIVYSDSIVGAWASYTANTFIGDNKWHFIVVTGDNAGNLKIYIDGNFEKAGAIRLTVGCAGHTAYGAHWTNWAWWLGKIEELVIYNTTLSAGEIKTMYIESFGRYQWSED